MYTGSTIELVLDSNYNLEIINNLRDKIREMTGVNKKYYRYHITLAYQFRKLFDNYDYIETKMKDLSTVLKGTCIANKAPAAASRLSILKCPTTSHSI